MVLERGSICVAVGSGFKPQNLHFCVRCKTASLRCYVSLSIEQLAALPPPLG